MGVNLVSRVRTRARLSHVLCVIGAASCVVTSTGWSQSVTVGVASEKATPKVALPLVVVDVTNAPLSDVLESIARQAGLHVFWNERISGAAARVSLRVQGMAADEAFAKALAGTGLKAKIVADMVAFVRDEAMARVVQGGIVGKVVDAKTKAPVRGATVTLDQASTGTMSGDDGSFHFTRVGIGTHTVRVRMLGYVRAVNTVTIVEGQTVSVDVALEPSVNTLDQVIVTGTVVATARREVPNAMTVITAKDIEQRGITKIDQLFRGDVPGLFSVNSGAMNSADQVTLFSRGATSLSDAGGFTNPIKTYVDGIELADASYLNQIDPKSIERIEILMGPQASTIYGSNAINGVMQIFTKRGSSTRPELTVHLTSGWIQNNYSPAYTPQHNHTAQVNGVEGRWSYTAGGEWNYVGPWSPAKQTSRWGGYGGAHLRAGPITADVNLRHGITRNVTTGTFGQTYTDWAANGVTKPAYNTGRPYAPSQYTITGHTLGLTANYTPRPWWTHEVVFGSDLSATENLKTQAAYVQPNDTLLSIGNSQRTRTSLRYATTAHIPLTQSVQAVVTGGMDQWRMMYNYVSISTPTLQGTLTGSSSVRRQPDHNTGGFIQSQLGFRDALFLTYGVRAEWNPAYGDDATPNLAPRYGIAFTQAFGAVTAKVRASYGRSTRPPAATQKLSAPATFILDLNRYGPYDLFLESPELGPEYQQGGLELYFGTRGSLVVTRYNQTVDALIAPVRADSARSLAPNTDGNYTYTSVYRYLNVGSIRNDGWELQASTTAGPLMIRGTYSWTRSRVIGITEAYRSYQIYSPGNYNLSPGASFRSLPEHTWAINLTHTTAASTLSLAFNGTGVMQVLGDRFSEWIYAGVRDQGTLPRLSLPNYQSTNAGYVLTDFNATHRFARIVEGMFQVQNLTNAYHNDYAQTYATIGRQTKIGLRIRL